MRDIKECLESEETSVSSGKDFANDIVQKKEDLTELVEALGPFLTSTNTEDRAKATLLLSTCLSTLPSDFLTAVQLNFISTFYCDRLKDHHSVVPATLTGVQALVQMSNLPDECVARLLQSVFHNVPCQSQVRGDREKIFNIIKTLSETKTKELLSMGSDFVYGFINAMDGERDPRILVFLFDYVPVFLATFPLAHLTDEMFEVIACYFPIDFNPSASDAATITRDLLAGKLSDCLCGQEGFADECINLLIEKLESQLNVSKLDSLALLSKSSQKFPAERIDSLFPQIWKALKAELLPGTSKDITLAALDALQTIVISMGKNETVCNNILSVITSSTVPLLSDVDSRLFMPAAVIILKCASANKLSAKLITQKCLPAFLLQINKDNAEQQVQRGTLIELSAQLIAACIQNEVTKEIDEKLLETAQFEFINGLMSKTTTNEKLINTSLSALAACAEIVNESNRILVYRAINVYLLNTNNTEIAINVNSALSAFAIRFPDEVSKEIVNELLNTDYFAKKLPSEAISELFEVLCCLIPIRKFCDEILQFLFKNIFNEVDCTSAERTELRLIAIRVLHHILDDDKNEALHREMLTKYNIADQFLTLIHSPCLNTTNDVKLSATDDILYEMSQILRVIVKDLDPDSQKELVEKYLIHVDLQKKTDLYFAVGLLGYLEPTVDLENHFEKLIDELMKLSLNSSDPDVTKLSNQLLCSLFNKCSDTPHHRNVLRKVIDFIKMELKKHNKQAVAVLSWISKGLLTSGHTDASELVDTLIELLEHPTLSEAAIAAFEVISIEFPQLHLPVIKHLFKQKLFQSCLKSLWHKLEGFSQKHLTAFVFVLQLTPHQVLINNIQKVGPVLLKCLTLSNVKALLAALAICEKFVNAHDEYFRDHLQNLVPQCLKLCTNPDSMHVRIAALHILSSVTNYPAFIVLPFSQDVLLGLVPALDDKKRLVRSAAVLARNQWFLIGSEK